jgi:hypothetical protein
MTRTSTSSIVILLSTFLAACAADGGGGGGGDDVVDDDDPCGFASDRYLPYEVGMTWTYQVTDLETGARKTKDQSLDETLEHPTHGPVIVQTTGKLAGSTRSLLRVSGDRVERLEQEDLDATGAVETTTTYDPPQIRIDESADRVVAGATWQESYVETVVEPGAAPEMVANTDSWEVIGDGVECESPLGRFECLHLRRTRTEGGVAIKDFFFARGVGKIRETGDNQTEELTGCSW